MNDVIVKKSGVRLLKEGVELYEILPLNELLSGPLSSFVFVKERKDRYRLEFNGRFFSFHKYHFFSKDFYRRFHNFSSKTKQPAAYFIICSDENKFYIGSSGGVFVRLNQHRSLCKNNTHFRKELRESYEKHGEANFQVLVIYQKTKEEANVLEQELMDYFKDDPRKLNKGISAKFPTLGTQYTQQQRLARSTLSKKIWSNPDLRKRMGEMTKIRFESPEARVKMSEHAHLAWLSRSEEEKQAISLKKKAWWDKPGLREEKSEKVKKYWNSSEGKEKLKEARKSVQIKLSINDLVYESYNEAGRALSIDPGLVHYRVKSVLPKWENWKIF